MSFISQIGLDNKDVVKVIDVNNFVTIIEKRKVDSYSVTYPIIGNNLVMQETKFMDEEELELYLHVLLSRAIKII